MRPANKPSDDLFDRVSREPLTQDILRTLAFEDEAERQANINELQHAVSTQLSKLPADHQVVVRMRYGLTDGVAYTISELGSIFNISVVLVRRILDAALYKLRQPEQSRQLAEFLDARLQEYPRRRLV